MRRKIMIGIVLVVVVASVWGLKYYSDYLKYQKAVEALTIEALDLSEVGDGVYKGAFDAYLVGAQVEVTVKDHKIMDILLIEHKNERGSSAEAIVERVLTSNSLQVDAISGATNSSRIILKAIELALIQGRQ